MQNLSKLKRLIEEGEEYSEEDEVNQVVLNYRILGDESEITAAHISANYNTIIDDIQALEKAFENIRKLKEEKNKLKQLKEEIEEYYLEPSQQAAYQDIIKVYPEGSLDKTLKYEPDIEEKIQADITIIEGQYKPNLEIILKTINFQGHPYHKFMDMTNIEITTNGEETTTKVTIKDTKKIRAIIEDFKQIDPTDFDIKDVIDNYLMD